MNERREDHKMRATDLMDHVDNHAVYGEPIAVALVTLAAAQTHATLALVEQQRIANLIALARVNAGFAQIAYEALTGPPSYGEPIDLAPDIAAALGIEAET